MRKKFSMVVRGQLERGIALDVARRDIAARIRRVCEHFGEDEFAALVDQMANIEVRYRVRTDWLGFVQDSGPQRLSSAS
jgi:hypothetical protein